jgi:type VI secretion system secreted protein VgrG
MAVEQTAFFTLSGDTLPGDLWVLRYQAREGVSRLFEVEVEFATEDASFDIAKCMRKSMVLSIVDGAGKTRFFHGIVDRAEYLDLIGAEADKVRMSFRVVLKPSITALQYRENSRIFQFKSTVEIIKDVFKDAGIDEKSIVWMTNGTYEPREFCVQYRESELAFVSRLMEEEGIFYFFRHTADGHKMTIADQVDAFAVDEEGGAPEVMFAMSAGMGLLGEPLHDFSRTRSLRTSDVTLRDFDFEKPNTPPQANVPTEKQYPMPLYMFPGGFKKATIGKQRAAALLASRRRDADVVRGTSTAISLTTGTPFNVEGGEPEWVNGTYVCIELMSYGQQVQGGSTNFVCRNAFTGVPDGAPWAPPRITPKPRIRGVQTAVVTGSDGSPEGIHTDKYGRVKVRFFWDRVGQHDQSSSCWLRVQQLNVGGSMLLPRIGWELAVTFINGDPDQPLALGRIYNGEQMAPASLPGAKASNSLKSMSTPGGAGHNLIGMGDSGGSQGHGIKAQKDLNITIGNDKTETIGVDEEHNVKVNMTTAITGNETVKVGVNQTITIGANCGYKITGNQSITVGAMETDNAIANYIEKITGTRSYKVGGMQLIICNGIETKGTAGFNRKVGAVELRAAVGSISDNVLVAYDEKVGAVKLEVIKGISSEAVGGMKNQTYAAAEVHLTKGNFDCSCDSMTTQLVGGLHYQKIAGDYSVKAKMITLLGAVGAFKGGAGELKLGGGPIVLKGSAIAFTASGLIMKMGSSMKMGG